MQTPVQALWLHTLDPAEVFLMLPGSLAALSPAVLLLALLVAPEGFRSKVIPRGQGNAARRWRSNVRLPGDGRENLLCVFH